MASFKDYQATKTARVDLFHGEHLTVRQLSSAEFITAALPFHRERLELEQALLVHGQAQINRLALHVGTHVLQVVKTQLEQTDELLLALG